MISICIVIGSGRQGIAALHAAAMVPLPILLRRRRRRRRRRRHHRRCSDAFRLPTV